MHRPEPCVAVFLWSVMQLTLFLKLKQTDSGVCFAHRVFWGLSRMSGDLKLAYCQQHNWCFPFLAMDTAVDGFCPQAGLCDQRGHNRVQRLSSYFSPLL